MTTYTPLLIRRIHRAARYGQTAEQMAKCFKREVPFIHDLCRMHGIRITGVERPDHVPGRALATERSTIGVTLANEALTLFEREAKKRGTSAALLAAQVLNLVAADSLFSAVLDA